MLEKPPYYLRMYTRVYTRIYLQASDLLFWAAYFGRDDVRVYVCAVPKYTICWFC